MAREKKLITGLSIGKDAVCLVQYLPEERAVANLSIQPIEEPGSDLWESASHSLRELVRTAKLAGENVIVSLPGEHAIIRTLSLDDDDMDAKETIEWEFSQQIIGSREEYAFDYEKIQRVSPDQGISKILAVGYRAESLEKLTRLLRACKLNPLVVDLDVFALVNVHEVNYTEAECSPAALVLVDEKTVKCVLAGSGSFFDLEILDMESASPGADTFASALNNGIAKILACNPGVAARDSMRIYLSGSIFSDAEYAAEVMAAVKNSELLYPLQKIGCVTGMGEEELRKYAPHLAVAVGLAVRGNE